MGSRWDGLVDVAAAAALRRARNIRHRGKLRSEKADAVAYVATAAAAGTPSVMGVARPTAGVLDSGVGVAATTVGSVALAGADGPAEGVATAAAPTAPRRGHSERNLNH